MVTMTPKLQALLVRLKALRAKKRELEKLYQKALKEEAAAEEKTVSTIDQE